MGRTLMIWVGDDQFQMEKAREWAVSHGNTFHGFTTNQWNQGLNDPNFRTNIGGEGFHNLSAGNSTVSPGGKVLQFPSQSRNGVDQRVATMNEIESVAIQNAILEFKGNLTEAAKALGIGRATLYRKVKQYNIDPSVARSKTSKVA